MVIRAPNVNPFPHKRRELGNCSNVGFKKEIEPEIFELACEKCKEIIGKYRKGQVILDKNKLRIEIKRKEKEDRACECCYDYRYDNVTWKTEEKQRRIDDNDLQYQIKFELEANEYRSSRAQFTKYIFEECFQEDLEFEDSLIGILEKE